MIDNCEIVLNPKLVRAATTTADEHKKTGLYAQCKNTVAAATRGLLSQGTLEPKSGNMDIFTMDPLAVLC